METAINPAPAVSAERSLLIVEDDKSFLQRLARAMEGRGFTVTTAETVSEGLMQVEKSAPAFAVVDMRLGDGNGLDVISALKRRRPEARGIVLTGYGNIATAVNAVKLGAVDYLAKPADADDVVNALLSIEGKKPEPPEHPMSADRVRWEHIQRIYELCGRNVSETARQLNMHRRTLQRILRQARAAVTAVIPEAAVRNDQKQSCSWLPHFIRVRPSRIDQGLQPQRRAMRNTQRHHLARRCRQLVLRRVAQTNSPPKPSATISPVSFGKISHGTSHRRGEEQPVAMHPVVHPFLVGPEIGDR